MRRTVPLVVGAMSLALASAQAAPVYSINGAPAVPIDPSGVINIGTLGTDLTLHIFDSVTLGSALPPQASVGQLVIRANVVQGGSLTVGVVDGDDFPTVDNEPGQFYNRGLISLGGLRLESPLNPGVEDPALRDATTLIAWIGNPSAADPGSITGTISVGRVYALDVPGDLSGIVTATANDPNLDQGQMAIQRVRVGGNLSGTVQATGGTPALNAIGQVQLLTQTASINTVIVGPGSNSLLASVPAPAGRRDGATR